MRGAVPIDLPPPGSGWLADRPLHKFPIDSLISQPGTVDSLNTYVDLDGLMKPRMGYEEIYNFTAQVEEFQQTRGLPLDPTQRRLIGAVSWTDVTGTIQFVIATMQGWWAHSGLAFVDITGTPNNSHVRLPTRFAPFGVDPDTGKDVLYGVNGSTRDVMRRWDITAAAYTDAITTLEPNRLHQLKANDIAVVGNRLVAVNTFDDVHGQRPQGVVWSEVLNGQIYHALSFNELTDGNLGCLLAIRPTSRTSAVIYAERGQWVITAQQGSNASAFRFDRMQSTEDGPVIGGPVTASAIIDVLGQHYFVSIDRQIAMCNGQTSSGISGAIDSFLKSSSGLAMGPGAGPIGVDPTAEDDQLPVTLLDKDRGKVWFFVSFVGDRGDARHAVLFDLRRGGVWEPPQELRDGVTMAISLLEQNGPTWDNPGIAAQTTLAGNIGAADTTLVIADPTGFTTVPRPDDDSLAGVVQMGTAPGSEMIGYQGLVFFAGQWLLVGCTRGAYGTVAIAHMTGSAVVQYYSWNTAPWPNWDAIPADFDPAMYLGTKDGRLLRFFKASTDRGQPISWRATWAPINPGPNSHLRVNTIDFQLNPMPMSLVPVSDLFSITLTGYEFVYANPRLIYTTLVASADPATWHIQLPKNAAQAANVPMNFLRCTLRGVSAQNGPWIAGVALAASVEDRPDTGGGFPP